MRAPAFVTPGARYLKQDIGPLANAGAWVRPLQRVRFVCKESGRPALGLIAEEAAKVFPELVERDAEDGEVSG